MPEWSDHPDDKDPLAEPLSWLRGMYQGPAQKSVLSAMVIFIAESTGADPKATRQRLADILKSEVSKARFTVDPSDPNNP